MAGEIIIIAGITVIKTDKKLLINSERPALGLQKTDKKKEEERLLLPDLRRSGDYRFPPFGLLDPGKPSEKIDRNELFEKKRRIEEKHMKILLLN